MSQDVIFNLVGSAGFVGGLKYGLGATESVLMGALLKLPHKIRGQQFGLLAHFKVKCTGLNRLILFIWKIPSVCSIVFILIAFFSHRHRLGWRRLQDREEKSLQMMLNHTEFGTE